MAKSNKSRFLGKTLNGKSVISRTNRQPIVVALSPIEIIAGERPSLLKREKVKRAMALNDRRFRAGRPTVPIEILIKKPNETGEGRAGIGSSLDSKRVALHGGWRVSKSGELYAEYRTNRTDRAKSTGK